MASDSNTPTAIPSPERTRGGLRGRWSQVKTRRTHRHPKGRPIGNRNQGVGLHDMGHRRFSGLLLNVWVELGASPSRSRSSSNSCGSRGGRTPSMRPGTPSCWWRGGSGNPRRSGFPVRHARQGHVLTPDGLVARRRTQQRTGARPHIRQECPIFRLCDRQVIGQTDHQTGHPS